jgi:hypothetical protein
MEHAHHAPHAHHAAPSLSRTAWSATLHCLTGCAIGEVLGMVIGTALGWGNAATIALAVVLAFFFGYALTLRPLLRAMSFAAAMRLALAADTASITVMEIVDNAIMLVIPAPWMRAWPASCSGRVSPFRSRSPQWRLSPSTGG